MAPLKLAIRLTGTEPQFDVDVDDDETIQVLGALIFSLRPAVGENPRIVHKGKILRADEKLSAAGIKSGDVVAAVRSVPAAAATGSGSKLEPPPRVPEQTPAAAETAAAEAPVAAVAATPADVPIPQADASPVPFQDVVAPPSQDEDTPMTESHPEKKQRTEEHPVDEAASDTASTAVPTGLARQTSADSQACSVTDDYSTPDGLQALARRLQHNPASFSAERTTQALSTAAEKIHSLEGQVKELAQALYMTHTFSGLALQKLSDGGEGGLQSALQRQESGESSRSFMYQKGDAETQELHAAAAAKRPTMTGGVVGGGTLSSKPTSREEMEAARKARLAKLEADQAQKKKELEDADEKTRSREAMFNRPNVGPSKPLGKF